MAWHGSEAFHRFEIQHRINIVRVSYMNVLLLLTLNVHRRSGVVSATYENIQANGYQENILGMTIRCVKEFGSSERTQTCS